jgi:hypothetical protein
MSSTRVNPKPSKRVRRTKLLIISGGKLAVVSAPLSAYVGEFLEDVFGPDRSKSPELFRELGWIDERGNVVGDHTTGELLGMEFDPAYVKPLELFKRLGVRAIELGLRRVEGEIPGYPFDHVAYSGTANRLQGALPEAGISAEVRAHLFTRSEHRILSSWLRVHPNESKESLGRDYPSYWDEEELARKIAGCEGEDRCVEAAVATILLRSIEYRLPNWGTWSPETGVLTARTRRPRTDSRKLHLVPKHLFTINWASSGPGYSWPVEYNLCWVPLYEKYVVTVSADSPEGLAGYTDLALGSFGRDRDVKDRVGAIVVGDWYGQFMEWNQAQWKYVAGTGSDKH